MIHKIIFSLFIGFYAITMFAVPAKRERHTLSLSDGSTVEATLMGDEMQHFYQTDDGRCLLCDDNGIAHFVEADVLQARWKAKLEKRQKARTSRKGARHKELGTSVPLTGSKTGLVILVQFPGTSFHYTNDTFNRLFNEQGFAEGINAGSVRDYFRDASYGQFDFSFDVVGPITMGNALSYYGGNNSNGDDKAPAAMVAEAVGLLDAEVDFSKYDWDGDGVVEQIFLIHSGYDEAQSGRTTDIWSHAWTLTEAIEEGDGNGPVTVDGVIIDSYATSAELRERSGTKITGIGTACHEFSHCFGLPDFYDTVGRNFGMNSWDLMDYGSYNGNGGTPASFTSYERMFCGWLKPTELTEPVAVRDMPALTSEPVAYLLRNSGKEDEFFLFENRQKESWDSSLGGHGMLILHVDFDSQAWIENTVNTERSHQRMTIVPADNSLYSGSLAGDPWPGTSNKTELSDTSSPSAKFYNNNAEGNKRLNHAITEISEQKGLISFIFDEEALGFESIQNSKLKIQDEVYDLSGRKLSRPAKGVYIIKNGQTKRVVRYE